ncbi:hypothetical protein EDD18DRAFT_1355466 [Armillaria luteobubalina]|uniref:Uncharacterized protein n=1 Tax=Armillaria luteobubalina TaxID=153913 RepID=A0AA39UMV4_9AGAR|nr:hypothetical protein EDD18DRAFT_1355466 [Armillaria luteobubalina]
MLARLWDITTASVVFCAVFLSPASGANFQNNTFLDMPQLLSASILLRHACSVDVWKQVVESVATHEPITSDNSSFDQIHPLEISFVFATCCVTCARSIPCLEQGAPSMAFFIHAGPIQSHVGKCPSPMTVLHVDGFVALDHLAHVEAYLPVLSSTACATLFLSTLVYPNGLPLGFHSAPQRDILNAEYMGSKLYHDLRAGYMGTSTSITTLNDVDALALCLDACLMRCCLDYDTSSILYTGSNLAQQSM